MRALESRPDPSFKVSRSSLVSTIIYAFVAAALAAGISFFLPKSYRAEGRILPNLSTSGSSSLLALAAGSGLADLLGGQLGAAENPILTYPEILLSRTVIERTLLSAANPKQRIIDALEVSSETSRQRLDDGIRVLRSVVDVRANPRSGLISVAAVTSDSVLSATIVERMLEELNRFNLETRTSQGRATREFIEDRMAEARRELVVAEQALAGFRATNIHIGNSPQLSLQRDRLEREVAVRNELFQLLSRQYEMARIEEKRDTPTFSVIDSPKPPVRKYRPKILLNAIGAAAAAVLCSLIYGYLRRHRTHPKSIRPINAPA